MYYKHIKNDIKDVPLEIVVQDKTVSKIQQRLSELKGELKTLPP